MLAWVEYIKTLLCISQKYNSFNELVYLQIPIQELQFYFDKIISKPGLYANETCLIAPAA